MRSFVQADAKRQAHLQFAQTPHTISKLQKSLPFFLRTRQHSCNLTGFFPFAQKN